MLSPAYVLRDNTSRPMTHIGLNIRQLCSRDLRKYYILHCFVIDFIHYTNEKPTTCILMLLDIIPHFQRDNSNFNI